jgi:hypothetical protein
MGAAPDFETEIGKEDSFVVGHADHMEVGTLSQGPMLIDRTRNQGIMIARQENDRDRRAGNYAGNAIQKINWQPVAIECVAGKHHDVGGEAASGIQNGGETGRAVTAMQPRRIIVIQVQIGAVNDNNVLIGRDQVT